MHAYFRVFLAHGVPVFNHEEDAGKLVADHGEGERYIFLETPTDVDERLSVLGVNRFL